MTDYWLEHDYRKRGTNKFKWKVSYHKDEIYWLFFEIFLCIGLFIIYPLLAILGAFIVLTWNIGKFLPR